MVPGETALAFYKAKNPTDKAITGISTYNVIPFEAGQYFNKIQVKTTPACTWACLALIFTPVPGLYENSFTSPVTLPQCS